jgi:tetratricopeptide (TPR) repeat protein
VKYGSLLAIAGGLLMAAVGPAVELSAQQLLGFGDEIRADCSNVAQGDVRDSTITIVCGMPHADVMELVGLAASPEAGDRQTLIARLDALVPADSRFRVEAIARFFEVLGEVPVENEKLADRFAEIATEHVRLLEEIHRFRVRDPEVQALKDDAASALEVPDHDRARAKLEEARQLVRAKREAAAKLLAEQQREEAALVSAQAGVEAGRLRYAAAAILHEEAATLLPEADVHERWAELIEAAGRWYDQGDEFGDNGALNRAIELHREALELAPRERVPLDWAMTQSSLGNALLTLGERESGTARLEEAVTAYRAALEERTRDRVPLDWATTQSNLGIALSTLGERESGTARLNEAVAAYRAALEEFSRARAAGLGDDPEQPGRRTFEVG